MIWMFFWGVIAFLLYSSLVIILYPFDPLGTKFRWQLARMWGKRLVTVTGIRFESVGQEALPPGPAIFVCNHLSTHDIYVIFSAIKRPLRWISKNENKFIPMVGWAAYSMHYVFVKRDHSSDDREKINHMADRLKADNASVMIFPEGTRVRSGELGEFKKGAFHMAKRAKVQVIPLCIEGTERVKKERSLWRFRRHPVKITFGTAIPAADVEALSVDELADRARQQVLALLANASA